MSNKDDAQEILWSNEHWLVTPYGLEARGVARYFIPKARLAERMPGDLAMVAMWPVHLCQKTWVVSETFWSAFTAALHIHAADAAKAIDLGETLRRVRAIGRPNRDEGAEQ